MKPTPLVKTFLTLLLLPCISLCSMAQARKVTGKIFDEANRQPLPDVTLLIKQDNQPIPVLADGSFSFNLTDPKTILVASYVGYAPQEIEVGNKTQLSIAMVATNGNLGDIVVVGYGTQKKKAVTGSVVSVGYDEFKDRSFSNITQSLAGQVAGVNISQSQGAPGSLPVIRIRGISSITAGTSPLIVVDGVPLEDFNLNMINPQDIQSVEILKDASSASIYGSRGSNGVIMVTTKLGKAGKASVNIGVDYGIQKVTRKMEMMDAQQWIRYYIDAKNNAWVDLNPAVNKATDPNSARGSSTLYKIPEEFITNPQQFGKGTDWQDVMFSTAPVLNTQLSVSGGTEKTQYLFSAAYLDQDGVLDQNYYKRLTVRSNIRQKITNKITLGLNLNLSGVFDRTEGVDGKSDVISLAHQSDPIFPLYNENGNLGIVDPNSTWNRYLQFNPVNLWHPYATTRFTDKENKAYNTFALGFAEYEPIKGLKLKSSISANVSNNNYNYYLYKNQGYGFNQSLTASNATASSGNKFNWLSENTANYDVRIGEHQLNILAGYTAQKERTAFQSLSAGNFPNDLVQTLNAGTITGGTTTATEWSMGSYLGRINYNYKNRYFLTSSLRRDGSSRFSTNSKWGYFPSVSAGWVASDENFLQKANWLNLLKLKASYGVVGNNQIPNYGSAGLLGGVNYVSNGNILTGLNPITVYNPDLRWEKTTQLNVGFDISILKNRVSATVEFYRSITKDMLLNVPIPDISGFSTQLMNIGKMRNMGLDVLVSTKNIRGAFNWSTDLNLSFNRNKVLQLGMDGAPIFYTDNETMVKTAIGNPLSDFYGYVFEGIYNNQAEIDKSPHEASTRPGDPIIKDVNGDGKITVDDRTVIGNNQPDFIAGITNKFSYKNFELSVLVMGAFGGEIVNQSYRFLGFWNSGRNLFAKEADYWQSEANPGNGTAPRPSANRRPFQQAFSTSWVEDATFVRIKNINLSYSLPKKVTGKILMNDIRVFVNADNVKLFSSYTGYDPENTTFKPTAYNSSLTASSTGTSSSTTPSGAFIGMDYGSYPIPLVITFGLKASF